METSGRDPFVDALSTAVVLLDGEDRIVTLNSAAEALLGVSQRRARDKPFTELSPAFATLGALCARARERHQGFGQTVDIPSPQRDGSTHRVAVRVSPYTDEAADDGATGLPRLVVELFDFTQRIQMDRETALVSQHDVGRRMLQQLAHEIRNPLGGLRGAAQLLERKLDDPALHEYTNVIIGEADRLAALLDQMTGPGGQVRKQPNNIHRVVEHVATIVCSESPELTLLRDYDPSLPLLDIDPDQITQALLNVMRNAAQATGPRGTVLLRTRARTNQVLNQKLHKRVVVVEIEDDGPGVSPEIADTIFYPLVTGRDGGTGIGLPLAQDLVNRHEGLIEFESVPGKTVFAVSLPVHAR